jgi:thiamine biosynthesis protein ThiI
MVRAVFIRTLLWFHVEMPALHVVARYHEIALKRGNRGQFVQQLANNIARILRGTGVKRALNGPGRLIIPLAETEQWPEVRERLRHVFGLTSFLLCQRSERSTDVLARDIIAALGDRPIGSFAVRTKRADKQFPLTSPEICRQLGSAVQEHTHARVDLEHPETEIFVELLDREAFFSLEKVDAPGGLPLGASGRVLTLLSGGIDSPVAAYRMLRRGCRMEFVHFHGAPYQGRESQQKARELIEVLCRWQPDTQLHCVAFGDLQRTIVTHVQRRYRVILYRRLMVRVACALAERSGATAIVTGESLGQVASQTLTNLGTIEAASPLPILRPLVGMDKQEIINQAERLGTLAISNQPDDDCCQLFVPRHPSTAMRADEADRAEAGLDIDGLVATALSRTETTTFSFPRARDQGIEGSGDRGKTESGVAT